MSKKSSKPKSASKTKPHLIYHADGSIWAKGQTANGKMEGYWQWFRKDGTIMRSGYFKNEKQIGKWTTYDSKGKIVKVTKFD